MQMTNLHLKHGIDICSIDRISKIFAYYGTKFFNKVFTVNEIIVLKQCPKHHFPTKLAGKFAAKEAMIKAMGHVTSYSALREIEIVNYIDGKPGINLYGQALEHYKKLSAKEINLSISHEKEYAIASVIIVL